MVKKLMSVDEFLKSGLLERADVVLCSSKKNLFSRLIRFGTRSPFCHAALVFVVPSVDMGFEKTFVIESGTSGVDITPLEHYVVDSHYQVGIKRLERPWFQGSDEGRALQREVRGHMLNFIKAEYDYMTIWRVAMSIFDRMVFGMRRYIRKGTAKALDQGARAPNSFVCSGFVQYGFHATVSRTVQQDGAAADRLDEVVFYDSPLADDPLNSLLAVTPDDLARTGKLAWKWVISKGDVYEVDHYADACRLMVGQEA